MRGAVFFHVMSASCRMPMFRFALRPFFGIGMPFCRADVRNSVFFIAAVAVAFCSLRSVLRAGGVIVGNVVSKTMPERITACKSFRSFLATRARIIIGCRFGAGCGRSKIFFRNNLLVVRMDMPVAWFLFFSAIRATAVNEIMISR